MEEHAKVAVMIIPGEDGQDEAPTVYKVRSQYLSVSYNHKQSLSKHDFVYSLKSSKLELISSISSNFFKILHLSLTSVSSCPSNSRRALFDTDLGIGIEVVSQILNSNSSRNFRFYCSFCQIINEEINDLLSQETNLTIKEGNTTVVKNLSEYRIQNPKDFEYFLSLGLNRATTYGNLLLLINVDSDFGKTGKITISDIDFKDTASKAFTNIIHKLSNKETQFSYSKSKLTLLLKETLNANSKIALIPVFGRQSDPKTLEILKLSQKFRQIKLKYKNRPFKNRTQPMFKQCLSIGDIDQLIQDNACLTAKIMESSVDFINNLCKDEAVTISNWPKPSLYKAHGKSNSITTIKKHRIKKETNVKDKIIEYKKQKLQESIEKLSKLKQIQQKELESQRTKERKTKERQAINEKRIFEHRQMLDDKMTNYEKQNIKSERKKIIRNTSPRGKRIVLKRTNVLIPNFSERVKTVNNLFHQSAKNLTDIDALDLINL